MGLLLLFNSACKSLQNSSQVAGQVSALTGLEKEIDRVDPTPLCAYADLFTPGSNTQNNQTDRISIMGKKMLETYYKPACERYHFIDANDLRTEYTARFYVVSFYLAQEQSFPMKYDCLGDDPKKCPNAAVRIEQQTPGTARSCAAYVNKRNEATRVIQQNPPADATTPNNIDFVQTPIGVVHFLVDTFHHPELARHLLTLAKTASLDDGFVDLHEVTYDLAFSMRGFRNRQLDGQSSSRSIDGVTLSGDQASDVVNESSLYAHIDDYDRAPFHFFAMNSFPAYQSQVLQNQRPTLNKTLAFARVLCTDASGESLFPELCVSELKALSCRHRNNRASFCSKYTNAAKIEQLKIGCASVSEPILVPLKIQKDKNGLYNHFIDPWKTQMIDVILPQAEKVIANSYRMHP